MMRPRTTVPLSPAPTLREASPAPTWQVAIVPIAEAVIGLVAAVESQPTAGPAIRAFQAAIRRKGQDAAEAGGTEAMEATLRTAADAAPDRAERRKSIIDKAWTGLPGWRI
ncbi:hypothetical protein FV220_18245 [Methylobacterium sp. WL19]|nr:hypothetical protein FV220_18245 [Methylobacterium sp. WL19]